MSFCPKLHSAPLSTVLLIVSHMLNISYYHTIFLFSLFPPTIFSLKILESTIS